MELAERSCVEGSIRGGPYDVGHDTRAAARV